MDKLPDPDSADSEAQSGGCARGCLYVVAGLSLLLGAFVAAIPMVVGVVARKGMDSADIAQLDEFSTTPQEIPALWQKVDPYDTALLAARDVAEREWSAFASSGNYSDDSLRRTITSGGVLTPDEITSITEEVTSGTAALEAFKRLVQRNDYDMNVIRAPVRTDVPWTLVINVPRLAARQAYLQALNKNWKGAFESTLLSYQVAKRHEASTFFIHLVANSPIASNAGLLTKLTVDSSDTAAMRYALSEMNNLEPRIFPDTLERGTLLAAIGELRDYHREGYPVNMESGHPSSFYHDQVLVAKREFATHMLKTVKPGDPRYPDFQRQALMEQASTLDMGKGLVSRFTLGLGREFIYKDLIVPASRSVDNQRSNRNTFDLTRLRLAQRITLLETGELITSASRFVPVLLPGGDSDNFTDSHYKWDELSQQFIKSEALLGVRSKGAGRAP